MNNKDAIQALSTVRSVNEDGKLWYNLTDISTAIGAPSDVDSLHKEFLGIPEEHRSIRTLYDTSGTEEVVPTLDVHGVSLFVKASQYKEFGELNLSVLDSVLPSLLHPRMQAAQGAVQRPTQWGEQPARGRMRELGVSVADTADLMTKVPGRSPQVFKAPSLNAVLLGRQLPSQEFVARAVYVFQRSMAQLFTPEVVAAYTKKYQVTPPSVPAPPQPTPTPVSPTTPPPSDDGVVPKFDEWEHTELVLSEVEKAALGIVDLPDFSPQAAPSPVPEELDSYAVLGLSREEEEAKADALYGEAFGAGFSLTAPDPVEPQEG